MQTAKVNIKRIRKTAKLPTYGTELSAGADLYAALEEDVVIKPGETKFIPTGLSIEFPEGLGGFIFARSGLSCKQGLAPANKVGIVDADYRGEVSVALYNQSKEIRIVQDGDRVAQIVFMPFVKGLFKEVTEFDKEETERGVGGFGHTGKK